jgi:hypothetical protein
MATRMYSLFRKVDGRWQRVPNAGAFPKATAIRVFQDRLIGSAFSGSPCELRPVNETPSRTPAAHNLCSPCLSHVHSECRKVADGGPCACGCRLFGL